MSSFAWDDSYSVGNEVLDNQHKELFVIFKKLNDKCMADDSSETYCSIIEDLETYSVHHFSEEEKYMKDSGYAYTHSHTLLHKFYMTRILEIKLKMYKKEYKLCTELIRFLGDWLQKHVIGEDRQMSCTLRKNP